MHSQQLCQKPFRNQSPSAQVHSYPHLSTIPHGRVGHRQTRRHAWVQKSEAWGVLLCNATYFFEAGTLLFIPRWGNTI